MKIKCLKAMIEINKSKKKKKANKKVKFNII